MTSTAINLPKVTPAPIHGIRERGLVLFLSTFLCGWACAFSDHTGYLREMKWEEWVPSFLVDHHLIEGPPHQLPSQTG